MKTDSLPELEAKYAALKADNEDLIKANAKLDEASIALEIQLAVLKAEKEQLAKANAALEIQVAETLAQLPQPEPDLNVPQPRIY
jgi:chromosome segregation ATPase